MRAKSKKDWLSDSERVSADSADSILEQALKLPLPLEEPDHPEDIDMFNSFPADPLVWSLPQSLTYSGFKLPVIGTVGDGGKVTPIGPKLVNKPKEEVYDGPMYRSAGYIDSFIDPAKLEVQVDLCIRALSPQLEKFDSIAFSGMSGALIAPPVAMALGKELIMVRKEGQSTHSSRIVEGNYASRKYIIVDDFRASGATEDYIFNQIKLTIPNAEYMGFLGGAEYRLNDANLRSSNGVWELLPKENF